MSTLTRAARHVDQTAGTAESRMQAKDYQNQSDQSRPLEQAGDVMLLLTLFPLTGAERAALWCLFRRRLRYAYGG